MSVEIWKGVCSGGLGATYDTDVLAYRESGMVHVGQSADNGNSDVIVMSESEAIDIALCILAELVPGMFYKLNKGE